MTAYAQVAGDAQTSQSLISMVILLVVFAAIFYFLLIRPQRRRQKEHRELVSSLKRGDRVITAGGIFGTVEKIEDDSVVLNVEEGKLRLSKSSIVDKARK